MVGEVRKRMVEGAVQLLARRGLKSTSFAEVLELTGTPRGSVYHHFPEGKDQLVGSAVDMAGAYLVGALDREAGASAEEVVEHFLQIWRGVLLRSKCGSGCAVLAVTIATDSPELMDHAATVFREWRGKLAALLERGGMAARHATPFATALIASTEGAVVLSRAEHSIEPFDVVAQQTMQHLRSIMSTQTAPAHAGPAHRKRPGAA
jgi:TetR/AcrR family transcriptional regulator, lmrAB and yxaGH operons repressor